MLLIKTHINTYHAAETMEGINDWRYDLLPFVLCFFTTLLSLTHSGAGSCLLSPFHNYVKCHIMHSQPALRPPCATLTFAHCISNNPP